MPLLCKDIIDNIQKGGRKREKHIGIIYEQCFHLVRKNSRKFKLDYDLVMGAYTDTILVFVNYVVSGKFEVTGKNSCLNFIMRTLDLKCLNLKRKEKPEQTVDLEDIPYELAIAREVADANLEHEDLWQLFQELDERCQNLLMDWLAGYSMEEMAQRNEMSSANVASVTNTRCKDKLRKILIKKGYVK